MGFKITCMGSIIMVYPENLTYLIGHIHLVCCLGLNDAFRLSIS